MMATRSNIIRQGEFAISNDIADKLLFKLTLSLAKMNSRNYFEQKNFTESVYKKQESNGCVITFPAGIYL